MGRPAIDGDRVVLSTIAFGDETRKADQVMSAPLDGSAPLTELVGSATAVDVEADGISYVTGTGALEFRAADSGKTSILDDKAASRWQHYRSGVLMTCEPFRGGWRINVKADGGRKVLFGPFEEWVEELEFTSDWARFVVDAHGPPTIYAIDTDRMKLFKTADTKVDWHLLGHDMALISPLDGAEGDITLIKLR